MPQVQLFSQERSSELGSSMVGVFEWVGVDCFGLEAEGNRETERLGMGVMSF